MKKDLYLFRHGQTEWNKSKRVQGTIDIPLSPIGIEQAKKIPQYLKDKNLEVIYSSHLERAFKTGEIVAKKLGIEIIKHNHLHEVYYGDAEGMTIADLQNKYGKEFDEKWMNYDSEYDNISFPNGETKLEARERIVRHISDIAFNNKYKSIGVSSHGFVIKQLIIACGHDNFYGLKNCEITHIEFDCGQYTKENPHKAFSFVKRIKTIKNP